VTHDSSVSAQLGSTRNCPQFCAREASAAHGGFVHHGLTQPYFEVLRNRAGQASPFRQEREDQCRYNAGWRSSTNSSAGSARALRPLLLTTAATSLAELRLAGELSGQDYSLDCGSRVSIYESRRSRPARRSSRWCSGSRPKQPSGLDEAAVTPGCVQALTGRRRGRRAGRIFRTTALIRTRKAIVLCPYGARSDLEGSGRAGRMSAW